MAADRENKKYLPGFPLPDTVQATAQLDCVRDCGCVVMAVPSHGFRNVFSQLAPLLSPETLLVSVVKGIEIGSRLTMTQVMAEVLRKEIPGVRQFLGVLSGPSFADEVAAHQPTAVTVAFDDKNAGEAVQRLFSTPYFRTYRSSDTLGIEYAAAVKNVVAIAAGICDGLGFGTNTRAALITRGLAEISRLGAHFGANPLTFSGLGGLGDLVLTCTGSLSRNRTVGLKIGKGKTLEEALAEMTMVAEGVKTTKSCYNLAKEAGVEMPILEQVYQVLYENKPAKVAVQDLFRRSLKEELADIG
jgi:glycerol-3-phosphate dehydrogenase (NAD(P)+)